ncbi:hypothetical protein GCM10010275_19200 [Streptomyces litmocidini]|nr:hypothetical protein GCM10010275_19200 [Streptomyces litmocidini]
MPPTQITDIPHFSLGLFFSWAGGRASRTTGTHVGGPTIPGILVIDVMRTVRPETSLRTGPDRSPRPAGGPAVPRPSRTATGHGPAAALNLK